MAHSEVCLICHGKGEVQDPMPPYPSKPCHGCGGKGWVEVQDQTVYPPPRPSPEEVPYKPGHWMRRNEVTPEPRKE